MDIDMPPVNRVDEIHDKLKSLEGQRIKVRANMGRSRIVEGTGVLVQVHPSLFVVEIEERRGRKDRHCCSCLHLCLLPVLCRTVCFSFNTRTPSQFSTAHPISRAGPQGAPRRSRSDAPGRPCSKHS